MKNLVLEIKNLNVFIGKKQIIRNLNLKIKQSECHIILGPNGSGKSSISKILAGHPSYKIINGSIIFCKKNILGVSPELRSHEGLFVAFQYPIEIPGLTNFEFLRIAFNEKQKFLNDTVLSPIEFMKKIKPIILGMKIKEEFLSRDLNCDFSGGEKKRNEILQMLLLKPKLIILDEVDSGLDIDSMQSISKIIMQDINKNTSSIIISHYPTFIENLEPNFVHIMLNGTIVKTGNLELLSIIKSKGFSFFSN